MRVSCKECYGSVNGRERLFQEGLLGIMEGVCSQKAYTRGRGVENSYNVEGKKEEM